MVAAHVDIVPAHVRHADLGVVELVDAALEPAEALDVALGGVLEQHLQPDADAEKALAIAQNLLA